MTANIVVHSVQDMFEISLGQYFVFRRILERNFSGFDTLQVVSHYVAVEYSNC